MSISMGLYNACPRHLCIHARDQCRRPYNDAYKALEKTIRQIWGNDLIVSPFFVIGGSDSKHFQARDFAPDVYTITGIQLESMKEFAGFHGVNKRIRVDEYGKTIGFFYHLMDNLEDL